MRDNTSLERVPNGPPNGPIEMPHAVQVPSYPVEVEPRGSIPSLLEYWRVLQKRRWTTISILTLVVVTVMIGTLKQQPTYEAKTVVQIDRETPNVLNFQDFMADAGLNSYDDSYLETAYKVLQSRSLAYRVIKKLDLKNSPEFAPAPPSWFSQLWPSQSPAPKTALSAEEQLDPGSTQLVDGFLTRLQIAPVRRSQLVEISFQSHDPVLSARIANTVASNYIDMNFEAKWEATQKASDWLSEQLVGLKAKLEKSEEELQRYATKNSILFLDEKQNMNSQKLQQLQQEATKAEADLIEKESLYNQVKDGNFTSVPGILENKLYQDLSMKLSDLKREYSDLTATFSSDYPKVKRLKSQIDETQSALDRETASFAQRVADDYKAAANRKRLLDDSVTQQTHGFNDVAEKSIQYNILKREAETNKQLYDGLLQRMKEASVSAGMRASNVRVVDRAEIPEFPAKPRKMMNLALALSIGLILGVLMSFFQEYLDNTLKTPEDVQRYLHLPTLGVIPSAGAAQKKLPYGQPAPIEESASGALVKQNGSAAGQVLTSNNDNFALSEAYRSLRTSVLLSTSGRPPRVILITSGQPGEGKTTTAVNLAIALTQLGGRVLIVDSDMRRPRVGTVLHLPSSPAGLSTYLTGTYPAEEVVTQTDVPGLYAIACGPIPPNPAELLSSDLMRQLLIQAPKRFEYVILDSPPVLHVSDTRILAAQAEAVILVTHGGVTSREAARHATEQLLYVNANLIGVALNNVDFDSAGHDYYYRYYGGDSNGYGYTSRAPDSTSVDA